MSTYRGGSVGRGFDAKKAAPADDGAVPEDPPGPPRCIAYGCPLLGSVNRGPGLLCHVHDEQDTQRWQSLTRRIREQGNLLDAMWLAHTQPLRWPTSIDIVLQRPGSLIVGDLMDTDTVPPPAKCESREAWLGRMRMELELRVGTRDKPVKPLRRQAETIKGLLDPARLPETAMPSSHTRIPVEALPASMRRPAEEGPIATQRRVIPDEDPR